ncbi:MAG: trypsin-like peptidase domain-containing protein [Myxococcales bacterium]|nr:trypsin-like peptidase domain-containing protein [Myxococcales bacterium]
MAAQSERGDLDGLRLTARVFFPRFSEELHAFEPDERSYAAEVLKVDEDLDLALLAVDGAPEHLPRAPIAAEAPYPGQRVAAIGHAGAGMLWAIKGGEVSSTGKLSGHTELNIQTHEGDPALLRKVKATFDRQGRVLQTTAEILPGDSGGPLVNLAGELVGVNAFVRTDSKTNQWLSFHVHLDTIRPFIAAVPARARDFMPDPWRGEGARASLEDADLDGVVDVLKLQRADDHGWAALIDLDQDSAPGERDAHAIARERALDVELAILFEQDTRHFWFDRDDDGVLESYLVDRKGTGALDEAYTLAPGQAASPSPALLAAGRRFDGGLFRDAELVARFRRIGAIVLPDLVAEGEDEARLPDPLRPLGGDVALVDVDEDGHRDLAREETAFHRRVLIDLDGDARFPGDAARARDGDADSEAPLIDVELVVIVQGARAWVFYDRRNEQRFDLVLHSTNRSAGVAHDAWSREPGGALHPRPEHAGRRLVRPDLFVDPALRDRVAALITDALEPEAVATDDGLGSLPALDVSDDAKVVVPDFQGREGWKNAIARVTDRGRDLTLVDVDGDSVGPGASAHDAALSIRAGEFDAEFVWLRHSGREWAFYDRDDDGRMDLVLYAGDPAGAREAHAFIPELAAGVPTLRSAPELRGAPLIDASVFSAEALRERFVIARELLSADRDEER